MDKTVGEQLKQLRQKKGLTRAQVAKRAGVSTSAVAKVESGGVATTRLLAEVAEALGAVYEGRIIPGGQADNATMVRAALEVPQELTATAAELLRLLPYVPADHLGPLMAFFRLSDPRK